MHKTYVLHPAVFKLDGGAMFGIIPKPLWEKKIPADEANRIPLSLRVMYIQTKTKHILIDTGIGDYHGEKFDGQFAVEGSTSPLKVLLKKEFALEPEMITDIVSTHLHFDHIGGLGENNAKGEHVPVFPNATLHLHAKHLEYAGQPTVRDAGSFHGQFFGPLINYYQQKNKLNLVEENEGHLLKDGNYQLSYRISHGHTPYMLHPFDHFFIYMADLVPMSHHISIPWVMGYDINPGQTVDYKQKFYDFILDKKLNLVFEHDRQYWGGPLSKNDKGQWSIAKLAPATGHSMLIDSSN